MFVELPLDRTSKIAVRTLTNLKLVFQNHSNPLNKIPGPWYARWTNLRLKFAVVSGRRIHYVHSLHERHGPIVRISPVEVAVADPELVQEIHKQGSGFKSLIGTSSLQLILDNRFSPCPIKKSMLQDGK
jgi:hypothetical protein